MNRSIIQYLTEVSKNLNYKINNSQRSIINDIKIVEKSLKVKLNTEHKNYLLKIDGGFLPGKKIIVYSAGNGIHPDETLISANNNRKDVNHLFFIARDSSNEFVFKKDDLNKKSIPVYLYNYEEKTLQKVADTFDLFIDKFKK